MFAYKWLLASINLFKLFVESTIKSYWFHFDVASIQLIFITAYCFGEPPIMAVT